MGWANCGTDTAGRPIGYAHAATCDHPGCDAAIDRGLSYACGGMHGNDEVSCDKYFCQRHRMNSVAVGLVEPQPRMRTVEVCDECARHVAECGLFVLDEETEVWIPRAESRAAGAPK